MTLLTPPGWLQNAGTVYTAQMMRYYSNLGLLGSSSGLIPRGGVNLTVAGACQVVEDSPSPSMNVRVFSGVGAVPGSENAFQGAYPFMNDGIITLALSASHATLNRIDLVIVRVRDSQYSGGTNNVTIEVVQGANASSPSAPAAPANSLILAQIFVGATVTSITNSVITDRRVSVDGVSAIVKNGDETVNNSTTFQNDDHFVFTTLNYPSGVRLSMEGFIFYDAAQAADLKMQWSIPSGWEMRWGCSGAVLGVTGTTGDGNWAGTFGSLVVGGANVGTFMASRIVGTLNTGSTPGPVTLQWAQNTADVSNARITVNSWIRFTVL